MLHVQLALPAKVNHLLAGEVSPVGDDSSGRGLAHEFGITNLVSLCRVNGSNNSRLRELLCDRLEREMHLHPEGCVVVEIDDVFRALQVDEVGFDTGCEQAAHNIGENELARLGFSKSFMNGWGIVIWVVIALLIWWEVCAVCAHIRAFSKWRAGCR